MATQSFLGRARPPPSREHPMLAARQEPRPPVMLRAGFEPASSAFGGPCSSDRAVATTVGSLLDEPLLPAARDDPAPPGPTRSQRSLLCVWRPRQAEVALLHLGHPAVGVMKDDALNV